MTLTVVRLVVAFAVVVSLVGAIGLVSAEMNTTPDESESSMSDRTNHMSGDIGNHMADHMTEEMVEMMQGHMASHDHGEHHNSQAGHC